MTVTKAGVRQRTGSPTPKPTTNKKPDIMSRVTKPGEIRYLRGILFGPPKTGKTVGATNTELRVLLVLTEPEGDLSIRARTNVDVVRPSSWAELNDIMKALYTTHKDEYDLVVFDSVTFMFEVVGAKEILDTLRANKDARRKYLTAGAAINQLIFDAVNLPMHVIFICQLKHDTPDEASGDAPLDPEAGEYPMTLAITPMVYKILAPAVSFVGRTYRRLAREDGNRVSKFWVSFEDYGRSPAGSRIPVPDQVENFSVDKILDHIRKETA